MKKFLIITSALLLLVLAFAACTGYNYPLDENGFPIFTDIFQTAPKEEPSEPAYVETDEVTPTEPPTELPTELPDETLPHEVPTDAPYEETSVAYTTEEPTEAPTVDPADPLHTVEPDFLENYASQEGNLACNNNIGSHEVKTEGDRTFIRLTSNGSDPYIAFIDGQRNLQISRYMAISYRTNATKVGQFFMGSGNGWTGNGDHFRYDWNENGEWNLAIIDLDNIGLTSLTDYILNYARMDFFDEATYAGDYLDIEYIAFFNEYEYAENYDFEMHKAPMWYEYGDIVTHLSFDQLYLGFDGPTMGSENIFEPGQSAGWDRIADLTGANADTLTYWGWVAIKGEVGQFGYRINKEAPIFNDEWTFPTEQPVIDAAIGSGADTGSRCKIIIDLSGLEGENTVTVLYRNRKGETVALTEFTAITPVKPKDITNTFVSNVNSNAEGTDLRNSDLAQYFTIFYGAGDPHKVSNGLYQYGGINEMYTDMNGLYAYVIDMQEASNTAMAFVRGTRVVHSVDLPVAENNLYLINNYFETDGLGLMGGAGIYAAIYNGQLNIVVKAYDPDCKLHIANKHYSIKADGTLLTIADNGETIYFMVEDKLLATIALSGETEYDKLCDIDPAIKFAQTAVVTLADGTTDTIKNTLVASTHAAQIGIALRPNTMQFSSLKVLGFNDVVIPDKFYSPERYENLVVPQDQWVISGHCPEIVGKEGHGYSPMVVAGGVESAALLHQGSIYLGNIDLSKYSKVVIYWGSDNGPVTIDSYNSNVNNRFALVSADKNMQMSPNEDTIIAANTYELHGWAVAPFEIDLTDVNYSGDVYLTHDTLPGNFAMVSSVEFIGAEKTAEPVGPETPENNNWVVDLSTIEGNTTWPDAGYGDAPLLKVGYDNIFNFGTVDLSKYSQIIIEYSYDGDNMRGDGKTPEQCFTDCPIAPIIGFTALNKCFGFANVVNQDAIDMGIYTALEYTSGSWASATRIATINTVAYDGPIYLSVFNPWGTEIVISSVTFVGKLNDFDDPSSPEVHEHDYSYDVLVITPTCTDAGYTTYTCACGDSYVADEVVALGHNFADGTCTVCGEKDPNYVDPEAPAVEMPAEFCLSLYQANLGKTLYFNGQMSSYYFAVSENPADAVKVYSEKVDGGYRMYFLDGETKKYVDIVYRAAGKANVKIVTEPTGVYVWNKDANTWTVTIGDDTFFLGTYSTYNTISASLISYITGNNAANVGVSQFPVVWSEMPKVEEHEHSYEVVVTSPTCTEAGYTTYICACGDSYVADEVAALGHNFADGTCTVCGKADPDYAEPDAPIGPEAPAGGAADFNTIELPADKPNGISSYTGPYTTAAGWVIENSAIQCGGATAMNPQFPVIGADNSSKAPCLNGKVNVAGKLTSPTLTGGISKLTINYTKMFTDTKLSATITITDLTTGAVYTNTLYKEAEKNDKYTVWTYDWVLETPITGDFTIEIVNDCPTGQNANKDRITILSLAWEGAAAVEPETPAAPNLTIPQDQWVISGHCPEIVGKEGHSNSPMVAAGGVESAALLHQGSIYLGNIDLSKYSKVVIYWGSDNSQVTTNFYNSNFNNRFALVNADKNMQMSPNEDTVIAAATYELHGWTVAPFEIDLTDVNYSGDVYLTHDSLPGGFVLVSSIEFIGTEKIEEPQTPAQSSIFVTTTDTYCFVDEYTFTASDAGIYTFTLPAGLGFFPFEAYMSWGSPIVDFYDNTEGYTFSLVLAEGEEYKYLVGAFTKDTWTITYTFNADGVGGDTPTTSDKPSEDFSGTYIADCTLGTGTVVIDTLMYSLVFTDAKGNVNEYTFDITNGVVTLSNANGPINPNLAMYLGGLELNADGTPSVFLYNGYEWVLSLC